MKKRYSKFFAYILAGSVTSCITLSFGVISMLFAGKKIEDSKKLILVYLVWIVISAFIAFLLTKRLNRRTPEGERLATWFRAYWLGFRIAFKIALCFTLILLPKMKGMHLNVSEQDEYEPHWYDDRRKVRDPNGTEYKVGRSGDYIKDSSGNWIKVYRADNGDPYIEKDSEKIWLQ